MTIDGNAAPVTKVLIDSNYFHQLDFPGSCSSGAGYAGGQGVTNYYGDGITVAHNTFKEVSWHYIQGGGEQIGMTVDHNLFEGPIPPAHAACTHLNVWQIWDGGRNDTFSNNIVRGEPGKPAAVTPLMFETGAAGAECAKSMTNTTVTNNLFVYSSTAYAVQILTTANLTYSHNTVVGGEYGTWLDRSDTCGPGSNLAAEHNIAVATQSKGSPQRLIIGACTGSCAVDYNVTDDNSAQGPHSLTGWTPRWQSTSYGNAGYYIPTPGLPNPAGYEGEAGP